MKTLDLIGQRFGRGIVIAFVGHRTKGKNSKRSVRIWKLKCDCGNEYETITEYLKNNECSSCGCYKLEFHNIPNNYSSVSKTTTNRYFKGIRYNAKKRKIDFLVSNDYLLDLLTKQNNKCKLSNEIIAIENKTASLDRIDNSLPYIEGNVQWVHRTINYMKNTLPQTDFIDWCSKVYNHRV